jgi:hypothetical protein
VESFKFLYADYQPKYWFWEFIDITRRLLLTAIVAIVLTGTPVQIIIAIVIALIFAELLSRFRPYRFEAPNNLLVEGQYQILFTFVGILVIKQNSIPEIPYHEDVLDLTLVLCNTAMLLSVILSAWRSRKHDESNSAERGHSLQLVVVNSKIRSLCLDNYHDKVLLGKMLSNSTDESVQRLLQLVFENIVTNKRCSSMKYVYYTPVSERRESQKKLRFEMDAAPAFPVMHSDVEGCTVYLRIPSQATDRFHFMCQNDGDVVQIPSEVFELPFHLRRMGYRPIGVTASSLMSAVSNVITRGDEDSWGSVSTPGKIPFLDLVARDWDIMFTEEDHYNNIVHDEDSAISFVNEDDSLMS